MRSINARTWDGGSDPNALPSVGQTKVPAAASRSASSGGVLNPVGVRHEQCSMPSTLRVGALLHCGDAVRVCGDGEAEAVRLLDRKHTIRPA